MFTIDDKEYIYIPLQYNMAWLEKKDKANESLLKKEFLSELEKFIKPRSTYIWDFKNLDSINDRGFSNIFREIIRKKITIVLANVETKSALDNAVRYEMVSYSNRWLFSSEGVENYLLGSNETICFEKDTIQKIRIDYLNKVIKKYCIETKYQYLTSSGVYSNMQINMKNLFYHPRELEYIVYLLWDNIHVENIQGIIATSKNGVAFASILGNILGYDVLHFNIGQMFEETYNCSPNVEAGGRYVHIYDMICLGSETKVLHALVNSKGAGCEISRLRLFAGFGCSGEKNRYSPMKHVICLLAQNELAEEYKIYLKEPKGEIDGEL